MPDTFTGWVTKYALTNGIEEKVLQVCENTTSMVEEVGSRWNAYYHGEGREWHRTRANAVAKAEEMRKKKITSLRKKIAALEALRFTDDA